MGTECWQDLRLGRVDWPRRAFPKRTLLATESTEGDELGEFTTIVSNWSMGDTFTTRDGRRFRILRMVPVMDVEDSVYNALWEVIGLDEIEPLGEISPRAGRREAVDCGKPQRPPARPGDIGDKRQDA